MKSLKLLWVWIALLLLAAGGCASSGLANPTADGSVPVLTDAVPATQTPVATSTGTVTPTPSPSPTPSATPTATPSPSPTPAVLAGAGDIAVCGLEDHNRTAALLAGLPGLIFTAGDNSNDDGRAVEYRNCFDPSWGQFKERIRPAPGNHDVTIDGGLPYYEYFGAAAGTPGQGWYSYDHGAWHIVVLNSNCNLVACGRDSEQINWLRADLAASQAQCTLAVWHHPRWSSGLSGSDGRMSSAFRALYEAGAEIVISGHDHNYERLTPLDPEGVPDPERGIRQFVVGTGGAYQRPFLSLLPESESAQSGTFGVLKLDLYPDRYEWEFIPVEGEEFTDNGETPCH